MVVFSLVLISNASAQGFLNLDFESASVPAGVRQGTIQFSQALPGWTETILGAFDTNVLYDNEYLDSSGISLIDTNAPNGVAGMVIDDRYTVLLQAGNGYSNGVGFASDTTLSQTGLVPSGTKSLQFKGACSRKFAVTLGGQALSLTILGGGTNYTLYGANISQWAGQIAQLSFTLFADMPHVNNEALLLDDIEFSTQSIAVGPPILLSASTLGTSLEIWWNTSGGTLQSSPIVGPGTTWLIVGTNNPTNVPIAGGAKFFRVVP